ncbi:MAG: ATP-dependent DNA helicase RecQ [Bacteroidota bacterium]
MTPEDILRKYWGYDGFRPLQKPIIDSVLLGNDTLALLPTGGGKSLCFQVPGLLKKGICVVISPLIALMKDQVNNLKKRGIPAVAIHSGMHPKEIDIALDNCIYGKTKFLYLSPERLLTKIAITRLKQMEVNLIAVDEAHCISQWGYDFRPAYLKIAELKEFLPKAPILALTATATDQVAIDIQEKLEFGQQNMIRGPFTRANLAYVVLHEEGKREKLFEILKKVNGTGVVYVRNRKLCKEIANFLKKRHISADFYHAGLNADQRSDKQDKWVNGEIRIIVATNAFGMGIDKSDVRVVVHMDLPDSIEAYFQEAGRAGRDGEKAFAVLLYNENDKINLERQYEVSFPEISMIRRVYQALGSYFQLATGAGLNQSFDFDIGAFSRTFNLELVPTFHCLKILQSDGWIALSDAVFVPAKLKLQVNKEDLYSYQVSNRGIDQLLKTILRTYQGAFNHYINIHESQLADFLKMPVKDVKKALKKMQLDGILDYRPQKDKPQLAFLQERVSSENMTIDKKAYDFRRKRQRSRIENVIGYATTPKCRSQQLLAYFGETDSPPCGICDVCLGRTKSGLSQSKFDNLTEKIRAILSTDALELDIIVSKFDMMDEDKVLATITYLNENGFIRKTDENTLEWAD